MFQLTAVSAGLFLVTVLAMIATTLGESDSPAAAWLNRNASGLIVGEVAAILILGFAAMAQDRARTRSQQQDDEASSSQSSQET